MKAKYGKKNEEEKTDVEISHGLKLISNTQKTDVFLERKGRKRTGGSCSSSPICVGRSHTHSAFEIAFCLFFQFQDNGDCMLGWL